MNDNAKSWVAALRSGKYKQGTGWLTEVTPDGEYDCCLGVACKLAVEAGVIEPPLGASHDRGVYYSDGGAAESAILPGAVREWLGLRTTDSSFLKDDERDQLTALNDAGVPFARIADIIESEPEELFE